MVKNFDFFRISTLSWFRYKVEALQFPIQLSFKKIEAPDLDLVRVNEA